MTMAQWFREKLTPRRTVDEKYNHAIALVDEVTEKMRERAASPDPFRALMADLFLQHHDIALVTESFQSHQESRLYLGPPPPKEPPA